jgi:hypothetical protein
LTSAVPLRWFRWLLSAWTAGHLLPRLPHLRELYCRPALRDDVLEALGLGPPRLGLVAVLFATALVALPAQTRWPRPAGVVVFCMLLAIHLLDPNSMRAYGLLATVQWGLLCVSYAAGMNPNADEVPAWAPRLLVAQWCSVYVLSVMAKLAHPTWRTGEALFLALNSDAHGLFLASAWGVPDSVARWMGWGAMATELAIGLCAWSPRTRWVTIAGALAFHGGVLATMRISPLFALLMWLHLPLVASLPAVPSGARGR